MYRPNACFYCMVCSMRALVTDDKYNGEKFIADFPRVTPLVFFSLDTTVISKFPSTGRLFYLYKDDCVHGVEPPLRNLKAWCDSKGRKSFDKHTVAWDESIDIDMKT